MGKNHVNNTFHALTPPQERKDKMLNEILHRNKGAERSKPVWVPLAAGFAMLVVFVAVIAKLGTTENPYIPPEQNTILFSGYTEPNDIPNLYVRNMGAFGTDTVLLNEPYAQTQDGYYEYAPLSANPADTLTPIHPVRVQDTVRYWSAYTEEDCDYEPGWVELPIDFTYATRNGKIEILEGDSSRKLGDTSPLADMFIGVDYIAPHGEDYVWLKLGYRQSHSIYLQYDINSGGIRDVLSETGLEAAYGSAMELSPNGDTLVLVNRALYEYEKGDYSVIAPPHCYLVNINTADYTKINIGDAESISISYLNDTVLSLWTHSGEVAMNFSIYDITTKELTPILTDVSRYSLARWGWGAPILLEEDSFVAIDPYTGEYFPIKGLNTELKYEFFPSPNGTRVGVLHYSETEGITRVGYIDMENRELIMSEVAATYTGYWSWSFAKDRLDVILEINEQEVHYSYDFSGNAEV